MTAPQEQLAYLGEILVVEDTPSSLKLLSDLLGQAGYAVRQAPNGELALWTVESSLPDLILLDINMPEMDGFEVCRRLKSNALTADVPVVFLSALFDVEDIVKGLNLGAVDYIGKPYVAEEVLARVKTHVQLARARRELQHERQDLEKRVLERTATLNNTMRALRAEVDVRRMAEEQLRMVGQVFAASFDGIVVMDTQSNVMLINPAFTRLTGYASDEAAGQPLAIIDQEKNEKGYFERIWQNVLQRGHWTGEVWLRHRDHNVFPALATFSVVNDEKGEVSYVIAIFLSVAERKDAETLINFLTRHDSLTGLPNRANATVYFDQQVQRQGEADDQIVVLCVDLDRFKHINDLFGHPAGDRVLQLVSDRLSDGLFPGDLAYRQGADEFIVIRSDRSNLRQTRELIQRLLSGLNCQFDLEEGQASLSASIGIASAAKNQAVLNDLVRNAGTALSRAKAQGGNGFAFFSEEMDAEARATYELELRLRHALADRQFEVFYQPQVDLRSGELVGAEALLRWKDPERGYISPALFIPVAEETGQIVAIGEWVLNSVCWQIAQWRRRGMEAPKVAVNFSARQFQQENLCAVVREAIDRHDLLASFLEVEITEGAMVQDVARATATLQELRDIGVSISVDDFGTGYSSLSYLKRFPLDMLKIDQSFVRDMLCDDASGAIVRSIIALGHNLNLRVIAEGVETREEIEFLRRHQCDEMQGYFFSKPLPVGQFNELIAAQKRLELLGDEAPSAPHPRSGRKQ